MASRGGQIGNTNAAKGKAWSDALRMELARDKQRLRKLASVFLDKCETGDISALKELGDRLDGKPVQAVAGVGENGEFVVRWQSEK